MSIRSIDIKNFSITFIIIAGMFAAGIIIGKFYFSKTDIKIIDRIVYQTVWKEKPAASLPFTQVNFDNLLACTLSEINFKDHTEKNYLFVTAFDSCKENTARYEIGQKGNWKVYAIIGGLGVIAGGYAVYRLTR
jgi:hypothetical protein